MRIGVDYYPEHWGEDRWPVDAALMGTAGITLVRLAEFAWCRMEPAEGRFTFAWLDRVLEILDREGIQAVLGTPTAAPPAWLHERYPEIYPVDARQLRLGFGTRLQRCLNNDHMREHARRITGAMAEHFGGNPAVIGWQIDNELEANLCYCEVCACKFRDWLERKHGTLEELNRAWGTIFWSQEYTGWSQIPLPWEARCGRNHNPSLMLDYQRFASESAIGFAREQAQIIRSVSPDRFITHNLMGLHDSLDYFQLGQDLDFVSWDNYPGGFWEKEARNPAMAHDVMRGIKQRSFWIMEEQSGVSAWEKMGRRPAPGQVRAWAWQAVGHGADTVMFFRWRSCLYGAEQFWQGVLDHHGEPGSRFLEIAGFSEEASRVSDLLEGSTVRNQAAILNSYEQNWALQIQPQAEGLDWWGQTERYYESLSGLGVGVDIVPLSADLRRYSLLIVPSWYTMNEDEAECLAGFAQAGGTLVLNPRTGIKTKHNTCHPLHLPALIHRAAGVEVEDYDPLGQAEGQLRMHGGEEFKVTVWAEALRPRGAEVLAIHCRSVFAGAPAVTRHGHGRGQVYYVGAIGERTFYDALLGEIMAKAGISGLPGLPKGIDASWRTSGAARLLFLVNLTAEARAMAIPAGWGVVLGSVPDGDRVDLAPFAVGIYRYDT